jgi:hypothetical protein
MSVSSEWERLRTAGAQVREMLIAAAAATWQIDPASCHAENLCSQEKGSGSYPLHSSSGT